PCIASAQAIPPTSAIPPKTPSRLLRLGRGHRSPTPAATGLDGRLRLRRRDSPRDPPEALLEPVRTASVGLPSEPVECGEQLCESFGRSALLRLRRLLAPAEEGRAGDDGCCAVRVPGARDELGAQVAVPPRDRTH